MNVRRWDTITLGLLKKEEEELVEEEEEEEGERMPNRDFFLLCCDYVNMRYIVLIQLQISCRTLWWCLKCVIGFLTRDIPVCVMYCVYETSHSSLLIQSTNA